MFRNTEESGEVSFYGQIIRELTRGNSFFFKSMNCKLATFQGMKWIFAIKNCCTSATSQQKRQSFDLIVIAIQSSRNYKVSFSTISLQLLQF